MEIFTYFLNKPKRGKTSIEIIDVELFFRYSPHVQTSRLGRTSVSPVNEYYLDRPSSSITSPTSSEPI